MSSPSDATIDLVHPSIEAYIDSLDPGDDALLRRLEEAAIARGFPLIGRASGRVLELLSRAIGARRVFELGSGFGFSAYFFSRAVGEGGEVICTEKDSWELDAHQALYGDHPLAKRVRYRLGSALDSLRDERGQFDAVLLDIDKESYLPALPLIAEKLRPGGLLFVDNVLWGGKVCGPAEDDSTRALQAFNRALFADPRFDAVLLPVGDGLAVARRR